MITNHNYFLSLIIHLLLSFTLIIGQHSSELGSGDHIRCFENERQALLKYKREIVDEYGRLSTWGIEENKRDCCKWEGVYCNNRTNHVTRLDLRAPSENYTPLQGKLISPSLLELQHLTYLDLSFNEFDGAPIPEFIGSFKDLQYLNLSHCYFSGSIPHHIGNLSKLQYLDLDQTNLFMLEYLDLDQTFLYSRNIEWLSHLHDLKYLNLNYVNLSIATNWLQSISKLNSIKELQLMHTNPPEILPSSFPLINTSASTLAVLNLSTNEYISSLTFHWFLNFSSSLTYIDLSRNRMNGTIPNAFDKIMSLEYLDLSHNFLEGGLPKSFGNMSNLIHLDLSFNHLSEQLSEFMMNLSGPVETKLQYLDLSWNKMSGSFPDVVKFSSLKVLDLSYNNLTGPLPDLSFCSSLEVLKLGNNKFNGTLSKSIGGLSKLEYLYLGSNLFEGIITEDLFFNLSQLQVMDLSYNNLTGPVPDLSFCSSLKFLILEKNKFSGTLTKSIGGLSKLEELHLGSNLLEGLITEDHLFNLSQLQRMNLSYNNLTGPVPDLSFCTSLKFLILEKNKFSGALTKSIGGLSKLEVLYLGSNLLEGIITEDHLFNLSQLLAMDLSSNSLLKLKFSHQWVPPFQLEYLSLASCELGPQFPKWIRNQKQLFYLDISNARISDTIPTWFPYLSIKLLYLNASDNQIIGSFPQITHHWTFVPFMTSSQTVDLSRNKVSGSVTFLCYYPDLSVVDLSDNRLSNKLPECFSNFKNLNYLNLANNNFSGKIPDSFGSLFELCSLHLQNNSFSGGIPTSMKNCTKLQMIDLGENRLNGKIPFWIGDGFSNLALLSLRSNEFFGSIPTCICGLPALQILDFSSNNISGPIPKCLSNLTAMTSASKVVPYGPFKTLRSVYAFNSYIIFESANFMWKGIEIKYMNNLELVRLVDLSNNSLSGEIPAEITKLVDLIGLNLSRNNLIGSIPQNIGEMKALNFLDLSRNNLSGGIPTSISELSHLGILNLSYNNLSGRIPQNSHMLTFDESAYIGNPGLCGHLILNKSCPGDEPHKPSNFNSKHDEEEEDNGDKLITEGFYIAMGAGFVIGFWGIFGTILFNKSVRFSFVKALNRIEDCVYVRVELSKARLRRHFQN